MIPYFMQQVHICSLDAKMVPYTVSEMSEQPSTIRSYQISFYLLLKQFSSWAECTFELSGGMNSTNIPSTRKTCTVKVVRIKHAPVPNYSRVGPTSRNSSNFCCQIADVNNSHSLNKTSYILWL